MAYEFFGLFTSESELEEAIWKWAKKLENLSQNLIHRLQSGKSYRWLSLRTEEKESAWFQSGIAAEE